MAGVVGEPFRIGLLGPSGVGKTSLVTAMLAEAPKVLSGGATLFPAEPLTREVLARNKKTLEEYLLVSEFTKDRFPARGTSDQFTFALGLDAGGSGAGIGIELLDFPGGWLSARRTRSDYGPFWQGARDFILDSTALLVPVDATLLMEARTDDQRHAVARLLAIEDVADIAGEWAAERRDLRAEPALALFCPVKCETYFSDNGGTWNRSGALRSRFEEVYRDVTGAIRATAPETSILYLPVDTLGCVELVEASWSPDDLGRLDMGASFRIRGLKPKISRAGAGDLVRTLCRHLAQGKLAAGRKDVPRALRNTLAKIARTPYSPRVQEL
jgi:hypothetical protein